MDFRTYTSPPHLNHLIRYYWSCDTNNNASNHSILFKNVADRFPRLVFQAQEKPLLTSLDNRVTPQSYLCGIETMASVAKVEANYSHFGVSFYPHALYQVFNIKSEDFVDNNIDLNFLGHGKLINLLNNADSHLDRVKLMNRFIEDQVNEKAYGNLIINDMIVNHKIVANTDLYCIQKEFKITERSLERLFKTNIGISPKKYQRMMRFEKSIELLQNSPQKELGRIAHQLGYTDQSHFIKDFKCFTNSLPLEFKKDRFLFVESSAFISKI